MAKPKSGKSVMGGDADRLFKPEPEPEPKPKPEPRPFEVASTAAAAAVEAERFTSRLLGGPDAPTEERNETASPPQVLAPPTTSEAAPMASEPKPQDHSANVAAEQSQLPDVVVPVTSEAQVTVTSVVPSVVPARESKGAEPKVEDRPKVVEEKGRGRRKAKPPTTQEEAQIRVAAILRRIRSDLPGSNGPNQRMFFPRELPQKLTAARCLLLDHRHRIPERSIALTGVLNFLEQLEKAHKGPFLSTVNPDPTERVALREMVGEFKETPQESFSFGIDDNLQQRLRVVSEYLGVKIRQIVATGTMNFLLELEDIYGCRFEDIGEASLVPPVTPG